MAGDLSNQEEQGKKLNVVELLGDRQVRTWLIVGGLSAALVVAYLDSLERIMGSWDLPQYSHGYLVPVFAAVLLWLRREPWTKITTGEVWLGVGLVGLGMAMRIFGAVIVAFTLDYFSIIPCLLGIFVMMGGLKALRWAGPPIVFLVFMIPLPKFFEDTILRPLQAVATQTSLFALQTLGLGAYSEGNRIIMDQVKLNVVDACSGLRMLTIFLALAAAIAMISVTRPWWERLIILVTAVPIAVAVNTIRITVTGLMYNAQFNDFADKLVHDWAGYFMMPLALAMLYLELQVLSNLFVEPSENEVVSVGLVGPGGVQRRPGKTFPSKT